MHMYVYIYSYIYSLPPPQLAQIMESEEGGNEEDEDDIMGMLPEQARERKRKREGRSKKEHYSNILRYLSVRKEEFRIERTDKGGATVVISAKHMNQEAREHITRVVIRMPGRSVVGVID